MAKGLNDSSLYMMAFVFIMNAGLNILHSRQKRQAEIFLKYLIAGNWGLFGLSYVILVSRLYIPFAEDALHIALYRFLLICDVFALGCMALYVSRKVKDKLPKFAVFLKGFGLLQMLGLSVLVLVDPGFSVQQTDLYVEILPSFSCQTGISLSMVTLIVCLIIAAVLLGRKVTEQAEKTRLRRDILLLALFIFLMIVHIPLPLIVGYELGGSLTIFIFRVLICATVCAHTLLAEA